MVALTGLDCKLYYNTGTYGTPTWTEIDNCRDLSMSREKGDADGSKRSSTWREKLTTLKDMSIEWEMVYDTEDANFAALKTAWDDNTNLDLAIADGAIATSGTEYTRAICKLFDFTEEQPLEDVVVVSVSAAPTPNSDQSPSFETVA